MATQPYYAPNPPPGSWAIPEQISWGNQLTFNGSVPLSGRLLEVPQLPPGQFNLVLSLNLLALKGRENTTDLAAALASFWSNQWPVITVSQGVYRGSIVQSALAMPLSVIPILGNAITVDYGVGAFAGLDVVQINRWQTQLTAAIVPAAGAFAATSTAGVGARIATITSGIGVGRTRCAQWRSNLRLWADPTNAGNVRIWALPQPFPNPADAFTPTTAMGILAELSPGQVADVPGYCGAFGAQGIGGAAIVRALSW